MKKQHIVSFSGGKDSTAMLIRMLELDMHIDEIVFADTTLEYPEMYEYIDLISKYINREIIILKPDSSWNDWFFGKVTRGNHKGKMRGFPLQAYHCWWYRESKFKPLDKYMKNSIRYIGIASDESHRVRDVEDYKYPLVEWGWSEKDCYQYLKDKNLLSIIHTRFKRSGCYLCPKQSVESLKKLKTYYPILFNKLLIYEWIDPKGFRINFRLKEMINDE